MSAAIPKKPANKKGALDEFILGAEATKQDIESKASEQPIQKKTFSINIDTSLIKRIKILASIEDRKVGEVAAEAIEEYLKGKEIPGV